VSYRLNQEIRFPFKQAQQDGTLITGKVNAEFAKELQRGDGASLSEALTVEEIGSGWYRAILTPSTAMSNPFEVYEAKAALDESEGATTSFSERFQVYAGAPPIEAGADRSIVSLDTLLEWVPETQALNANELTRLIAAASSWVETRTGRLFMPADITEWHDGSGAVGRCDEKLITRYAPVIAVSSVTENSEALDTATDYDLDADVLVYRGSGGLYRQGRRWACGRLNVKVEYQAGYEAIPPEITQLVCEVAWQMHKEAAVVGASEVSSGERAQKITRNLSPISQDALNDYHDWRVTTAVEARLAA